MNSLGNTATLVSLKLKASTNSKILLLTTLLFSCSYYQEKTAPPAGALLGDFTKCAIKSQQAHPDCFCHELSIARYPERSSYCEQYTTSNSFTVSNRSTERHTEQAGGEAVGCAGVGGEDAHAVEVAGGPEGVRVDEVMVAHAVHDVVALVVAAGDDGNGDAALFEEPVRYVGDQWPECRRTAEHADQ